MALQNGQKNVTIGHRRNETQPLKLLKKENRDAASCPDSAELENVKMLLQSSQTNTSQKMLLSDKGLDLQLTCVHNPAVCIRVRLQRRGSSRHRCAI